MRQRAADTIPAIPPQIPGASGCRQQTIAAAGSTWHTAAIDSLRLRPLAHFSGIRSTRRRPAATTGGPPGAASRPPGGIRIARPCIPQYLGMLRVQVDLILHTPRALSDYKVCIDRSGAPGRRPLGTGRITSGVCG